MQNLKSNIVILSKAAFDKRSPLKFKILLVFIVAYLLSPIDIIPDFIPVLGLLDEAILIPILLKWAYRMIPMELQEEYSQQREIEEVGGGNLKLLGVILVVTFWIIILSVIWIIIKN